MEIELLDSSNGASWKNGVGELGDTEDYLHF